jgi:hypothetical protein
MPTVQAGIFAYFRTSGPRTQRPIGRWASRIAKNPGKNVVFRPETHVRGGEGGYFLGNRPCNHQDRVDTSERNRPIAWLQQFCEFAFNSLPAFITPFPSEFTVSGITRIKCCKYLTQLAFKELS